MLKTIYINIFYNKDNTTKCSKRKTNQVQMNKIKIVMKKKMFILQNLKMRKNKTIQKTYQLVKKSNPNKKYLNQYLDI